MGTDKALLPFGEKTLLQLALSSKAENWFRQRRLSWVRGNDMAATAR